MVLWCLNKSWPEELWLIKYRLSPSVPDYLHKFHRETTAEYLLELIINWHNFQEFTNIIIIIILNFPPRPLNVNLINPQLLRDIRIRCYGQMIDLNWGPPEGSPWALS